MLGKKDNRENKEWRDGVYLCTAGNSFEADLFESKLRGEGIPCIRKFRGASNAMEIFMGQSLAFPIDIYVPSETLEDAKNIIIAFPLDENEPQDFN